MKHVERYATQGARACSLLFKLIESKHHLIKTEENMNIYIKREGNGIETLISKRIKERFSLACLSGGLLPASL